MQLQFTREEVTLLIDVLQALSLPAERKRARDALLNRLVKSDLKFAYDELEDLSDFLAEITRRLHDQLLRGDDPVIRKRHQAMQHVLDKVIEAEAMV